MLLLQASNEMIVNDENLSHWKMKSRLIHKQAQQQPILSMQMHVTPSFNAFQFPMNGILAIAACSQFINPNS